MKVCYVAVHKLHGVNKLPEGQTDVCICKQQSPTVKATLTANPEPFFYHIDKRMALANGMLNSIFGRAKEGTPEERLATEVRRVRDLREQQTDTGVFLIFEGETDIPTPEFKGRRDADDFSICLDAISNSEIKQRFEPFDQCVFAALALCIPNAAARSFETIGSVVYSVDPNDGKPIYSFTLEGTAKASVSSPLRECD